jgi:hypothetical protein
MKGFELLIYFLALGFTSFIGTSQHMKSQGAQPHGSSTATTTPQSSHLYLAPFFAMFFHLPKIFMTE